DPAPPRRPASRRAPGPTGRHGRPAPQPQPGRGRPGPACGSRRTARPPGPGPRRAAGNGSGRTRAAILTGTSPRVPRSSGPSAEADPLPGAARLTTGDHPPIVGELFTSGVGRSVRMLDKRLTLVLAVLLAGARSAASDDSSPWRAVRET